ncbi:MAG: neuromedin U [Candidatus Dadabacteria bacterium]
MRRDNIRILFAILSIVLSLTLTSIAQEQSEDDLAKQSQNPIGNLISVPFQNNIGFNLGPHNRTQNVLNIQPVIPIGISENWNIVTRSIAPVLYQPDVASNSGGESGLGDINTTWFLSPSKPGKLIWGLGPILQFPTATDDTLGTGKWAAGPSIVVLTMPGNWVVGILGSNIWSYAGDSKRDDVNQLLLQWFVYYNFPSGWYLSSVPINTANWEADSGDRWTIPLGGGGGKVFKIGKQAINAKTEAYYNVEHPDNGPEWQLRVEIKFLFPK